MRNGDSEIGVDTEPPESLLVVDPRPIIRVAPGAIQRITSEAEECLAATGKYFRRPGAIVTVSTSPDGVASVNALDGPALAHAVDGVSRWERFDRRSNMWVQTDPTDKHCRILSTVAGHGHLPRLNALARQPFLRLDGSICLSAGYDHVTSNFGVFEPSAFQIPDAPTREDALDALAKLNSLLSEFAYGGEGDRSASLAAILTATIRPTLPNAPMFHVRAHQISSGKSYLCELIGAFASPHRIGTTTFPSSEDECTKLLLAELNRCPAAIEFDNLTSDLRPFKMLCSALTGSR